MRSGLFLVTLALAPAAPASAGSDATLTYVDDVRPILERHCVSCHHPLGLNLGGMVAPMSLTTFEEVRPWSKAIARAVRNRVMPPWHASEAQRGVFRNERLLTDEEREILVNWVLGGAPPGSEPAPVTEVAPPTSHGGWSIGEPDAVIKMAEPFLVADEVEDLYVDIEVPIPDDVAAADRWIQAIECRAGSTAVHHLIVYVIEPGGKKKFEAGAMLGGIAPGEDPDRFPDGYARLLPRGSKLVFEMHYHKEPGPGTAVYDQSEVAFRFHRGPVEHRVVVDSIGVYDFAIPAGATDHEIRASHTFAKPVTLLGYLPHMHLRGKAARYVATYPDGSEELLLDVPSYDFDWQTMYSLADPKPIPAGTRIDVTMWYDNSAGNPDNPDPSVTVGYGLPTTDEMMNGFINYANTEPYDFEIEALTTAEQLAEATPNFEE